MKSSTAEDYLENTTYQALAEDGGTHGEIARRVVEEAKEQGVLLSVDDVEEVLDLMYSTESRWND